MLPNQTQRWLQSVHKHERDVRARIGSLYTRDAGEGKAVLLVHDFPLNSRMWEPQIQGLGGRYRLIAPDLAGFGLTPTPTAELTLADHAREILNSLNTLGIESVTVAGVSAGANVALHLVEELGVRLWGLFLVNVSLSADTPEATRWRHELAAETELAGVEIVADEFLPKLLRSSTQRDHPEILDFLRLMIRENTPSGIAGMLRALAARPEPSGILARIQCPVVCLAGEEDMLVSPQETRLIAERIPGALIPTIPETGHLPNLERPETFNELLMQFMAEWVPG